MTGCVFGRAIGVFGWLAATGWTVAAAAADEISVEHDITVPALSLRVPKAELVSFAGLRNDDTVAGKPGFMMYAGPLPAALVEVFAHGVIESHKQAQEKQDRNALSGNVLAPYQTLLGHFTNAELMERALDGLTTELDGIRRTTPGTAQVRAVERCDGQPRSLGLNYTTTPEDGRARFIPYVLHEICQTQQLDADDPVRCDYWLNGKTDGPMSFAGETVYSVRWPDGSMASGRFDPEQSRGTGSVILRRRPPQPK